MEKDTERRENDKKGNGREGERHLEISTQIEKGRLMERRRG